MSSDRELGIPTGKGISWEQVSAIPCMAKQARKKEGEESGSDLIYFTSPFSPRMPWPDPFPPAFLCSYLYHDLISASVEDNQWVVFEVVLQNFWEAKSSILLWLLSLSSVGWDPSFCQLGDWDQVT